MTSFRTERLPDPPPGTKWAYDYRCRQRVALPEQEEYQHYEWVICPLTGQDHLITWLPIYQHFMDGPPRPTKKQERHMSHDAILEEVAGHVRRAGYRLDELIPLLASGDLQPFLTGSAEHDLKRMSMLCRVVLECLEDTRAEQIKAARQVTSAQDSLPAPPPALDAGTDPGT